MRTMQYVTGNICFSKGPPGGVSHFVGRVYEPYVRVAVDSFTCGQEVDNLTNGTVNQFSMDKILKFHFNQIGQSASRGNLLP